MCNFINGTRHGVIHAKRKKNISAYQLNRWTVLAFVVQISSLSFPPRFAFDFIALASIFVSSVSQTNMHNKCVRVCILYNAYESPFISYMLHVWCVYFARNYPFLLMAVTQDLRAALVTVGSD